MTLQLSHRSRPLVAGFATALFLAAHAASAQAAGPMIGGAGAAGSPGSAQVVVITPPAPVPPVDIPPAMFRPIDTVRPTATSPGVASINDPGLPSKTFSLGGGSGGGGTGGDGGGTDGTGDIPNNTINPTIFGDGNGQIPSNPESFGTGGGLGELAPAAGGSATGGQGFAYISCVNSVLQNLDAPQQTDSYEKCRAIAQ